MFLSFKLLHRAILCFLPDVDVLHHASEVRVTQDRRKRGNGHS